MFMDMIVLVFSVRVERFLTSLTWRLNPYPLKGITYRTPALQAVVKLFYKNVCKVLYNYHAQTLDYIGRFFSYFCKNFLMLIFCYKVWNIGRFLQALFYYQSYPSNGQTFTHTHTHTGKHHSFKKMVKKLFF